MPKRGFIELCLFVCTSTCISSPDGQPVVSHSAWGTTEYGRSPFVIRNRRRLPAGQGPKNRDRAHPKYLLACCASINWCCLFVCLLIGVLGSVFVYLVWLMLNMRGENFGESLGKHMGECFFHYGKSCV